MKMERLLESNKELYNIFEKKNMKCEDYNEIECLIDCILSRDRTCVIDYFPQRIKNFNAYEKMEDFLLKKKNRKEYAEKITNVLLKLIPYFEMKIVIPETMVKTLKKYEGIVSIKEMRIDKLNHILKKIIVKDGTVTVLIEELKVVLLIQLYNTAVYFEEFQEIPLLEKIIVSEGLFYWKE